MYNIMTDADLFSDQYPTFRFCDQWPSAKDFVEDFKTSDFTLPISEENLKLLWNLLFSKYGDSHFADDDLNISRYRTFGLIVQHGPTWEKEKALQEELRGLSQEELMQGVSMINNHAYNPSSPPLNSSWEALRKIDDQAIQHHKRGKIEAIAAVEALLKKDVTEEFLYRFREIFIKVALASAPLYYKTERPNIPINQNGRKKR